MKNLLRSLTLLALAAVFAVPAYSQYCTSYHKRKCLGADAEGFRYNSQSKSALFEKGHTSDLYVVVHSGQDYRVSFCKEKKISENLRFKVISARSNEVLYDNAIDENAEFFEFSCTSTQRIIFRITAPGDSVAAESEEEESNSRKRRGREEEPDPDDMFCLGVLIENMPTPAIGF